MIRSDMQKTLTYKGLHVTVNIKSTLKHSYLKIINADTLQINTPVNSERFVKNFIDTKYLWILKHIQSIKTKQLPAMTLGKNILFLGKLESIKEDIHKELYKKLLPGQTKQQLEFVYAKYYKSAAKTYLPQRVNLFANSMNLYPKKLLYRKMSRRLGSCNCKQEITFNTMVMNLPPHLIDYVVVHELAHLKHMNHSREFHLLVQKYLPDANYLKQEIKNRL